MTTRRGFLGALLALPAVAALLPKKYTVGAGPFDCPNARDEYVYRYTWFDPETWEETPLMPEEALKNWAKRQEGYDPTLWKGSLRLRRYASWENGLFRLESEMGVRDWLRGKRFGEVGVAYSPLHPGRAHESLTRPRSVYNRIYHDRQRA